MRFLFWLVIWLLTFCSADIDVRYRDGLNLEFRGWIGAIQRWWEERR